MLVGLCFHPPPPHPHRTSTNVLGTLYSTHAPRKIGRRKTGCHSCFETMAVRQNLGRGSSSGAKRTRIKQFCGPCVVDVRARNTHTARARARAHCRQRRGETTRKVAGRSVSLYRLRGLAVVQTSGQPPLREARRRFS